MKRFGTSCSHQGIEGFMELRRSMNWVRVCALAVFSISTLLGGCAIGDGSGEDIDSVSLAACLGVRMGAPSPAAPSAPGTVVNLTATNTTCGSGETAEYRFAYQQEGSGSGYVEIQGWSASSTAAWNTTGLPSGKYSLTVYARAAGTTNFQSMAYGVYLLTDVCTSTTFNASPAPPQTVGTPVTLSAVGTCTGAATPEYRFFYRAPGSSTFTPIQAYGSSPVVWNTTGLPQGIYTMLVYVRAVGNTSVWEGYRYGSYELGDGGCASVTLSSAPPSPQTPGTNVTLTGAATCASGTPEYRFYYQEQGNPTWNLIQDWDGNTAIWNTTGIPLGTHTLRVDARKAGNSAAESTDYQQYELAASAGGWSQIAVGMGFHTCGVVADGTARCWGSNSDGQLGDASKIDRSSPATVFGLTGTSQIAPGGFHSCAQLNGGGVQCWGDNAEGQLGTGNTTSSTTPVSVSGISDASAVVSGTYHSCALRAGGTVSCWGDNAFGQIGNGSFSGDVLTPTTVTGISGASAISAGGWHTCALVSGAVWCWGLNDFGQIGNGSTNPREATPVQVTGLTSVMSVSAGDSHTCATRSPGDARCWGQNTYGQLGNGSTTDSNVPVVVTGMSSATAISAGFAHSCVRRSGGDVQCWGDNTFGELGDSSNMSSLTAVSVSGISTASTGLAAGGVYSCSLLSSGAAQCWGYNAFGQLGDGSTTDANAPVNVLAP